MNNSDKMKLLIGTYPRQTAKYLVNAFLKRQKKLFTKADMSYPTEMLLFCLADISP